MGSVLSTERPRLPPSPSTYAQFVYSQHNSRVPDTGALLDHREHIHFGPEDGVYDCNKNNDRIEDRYGHCFTLRARGWKDQPFISWGGDNFGDEVWTMSWGDLGAIAFIFGAIACIWSVARGSMWVMKLGKELRAEKKKMGSRVKLKRPPLAIQPGQPKKNPSLERVRTRRNGFSDSDNLLPVQEREELRTASRERRALEEGAEVYRNGEYTYRYDDSPYESEDEDDDNGNGQVEVGRCEAELELGTPDSWMAGCQGDLLYIRV